MRLGNFSVLIPGGREHGEGHVALSHGQVYEIRLCNHQHNRRCDARVDVDGKLVGEFRLNEGQVLTLERPADDAGRFTFFRGGSDDAGKVGESGIVWENRGLVRVTFRPERRAVPEREIKTSGGIMRTRGMRGAVATSCFDSDAMPQNANAGVTGLTGRSNQSFYTVSPLDYDPSGETIITLRLVCGENVDGPRELKPAAALANPTPAPVRG